MAEQVKTSEWTTLFEDFENRLKETAHLVASDLEGDLAQTQLYKLQNLMKKCEESKQQILHENNVISEIKQHLDTLEKPWECDVYKLFEEKVKSKVVSKPKGTLPSSQDYLDKLNSDELLRPNDAPTNTYRDPWTKLPIQDPVQSNNCKHFYERKIVMGVLKKKKEFRCPYIGCVYIIKESNIVEVNF